MRAAGEVAVPSIRPANRTRGIRMSDQLRKWLVLVAMGAILGVILLDETVVGVALPTIQIDLAMSEVRSHWVVNIYMLVLAVLAAAAGKFGDVVGHRMLVTTGLAIFGIASLACGFAGGEIWLIVARAMQGLGAAIIFPSSLAMVTVAFPKEQRGFALGIYGAIGTVFLALGPLVGGFLTDFASWRWIFWVNPPIVVAVGMIVLAAWVEPARTGTPDRIDKVGLVLLICGLSALVFALMEGPGWGWNDPAILALLAGGMAMLVAFAVFEHGKRAPLIDVDLFANSTFAGSNLVIFFAQYSKMSVLVFGALYLQDVLHMSPLLSGFALLPTVAPQPFTAPAVGRVVDRFGGREPTVFGVALSAAAFIWIAFSISQGSYALLFAGLFAWGLSVAFLFVPPQHTVMGSVPPQKTGQAGGIAMSSQLLGATIGMAVSSTVYSMSQSFHAVFLVTAIVNMIVLAVAWLTIGRPTKADLERRRAA